MRMRNWFLTINYRNQKVPSSASLKSKIEKEFKNVKYYVFKLEKGETGTYHHHLLICFIHAITFDSMKKKFPRAHINPVNGLLKSIDDYIRKDPSDGHEVVTYGNIPHQGKRTDLETIVDMLEDGNTLKDVRTLFPSQYLRYKNHIISLQQELLAEKVEDKWNKRKTVYIYGDSGLGKTRYVMEKYGYTECYRVTDYKHPFDGYNSEKTLIFEEFRSSLKIEDMLNYLDGYPLKLPARYNNKTALYDNVYIVTNIPLFEQYNSVQRNHPETFQAFIRRIDEVRFLVPSKIDSKTETLVFNDPINALHFSNTLYNYKQGYKPSKWNKEWFDEGKYPGRTVDKIKELEKSYDLLGYSYQAPEYKHKDEALYQIAQSIRELKELRKKDVKTISENNDGDSSNEVLRLEDILH